MLDEKIQSESQRRFDQFVKMTNAYIRVDKLILNDYASICNDKLSLINNVRMQMIGEKDSSVFITKLAENADQELKVDCDQYLRYLLNQQKNFDSMIQEQIYITAGEDGDGSFCTMAEEDYLEVIRLRKKYREASDIVLQQLRKQYEETAAAIRKTLKRPVSEIIQSRKVELVEAPGDIILDALLEEE